MNDELFLVYEQDDVQLGTACDTPLIGKLRIVEKDTIPYIEWGENLDELADLDWAVIPSPNVAFSSKNSPDSIVINNNCKKKPQNISVAISDVCQCKVTNQNKQLELLSNRGQQLGTLLFRNNDSGYFFDVIKRYVTTRTLDYDPSVHIFQNKAQANIDDQLSALDLVPVRKGPSYHRHHHGHHHWAADAPKKVWGFINNMKKDPYATALTTFSKVYDVVLYGDYSSEMSGRGDSKEVAELFHNISGMADVEPGFEILTKKEKLADRPHVDRLGPLTHEDFVTFVSPEGCITEVEALKQRIFKGGIHSNIRPELWCYLLGHYEWHSTYIQREDRKKKREQEYYEMKLQWKTFSEDQEANFSGYKDRKSIIEKDVNRTDRSHPFFEGESNTNLIMLNDILMTYIMYNFDLGYVQGMSDLLAPILYVTQNEPMAFWCFVGYMNRVYRNFDLDQSGMKQQLSDLNLVLRILDPEFMSFLEAQESANLYFSFRWLLVRFKRELNYADTMKLWEILWTDYLSKNFHLCFAAALLDSERDEIIANRHNFPDLLKHINSLSMRIDLEATLRKAEAIYLQLSASASVPNTVRAILNLPLIPENTPTSTSPCLEFPGHAERISPEQAKDDEACSGESLVNEKLYEEGLSFLS